MKTPSDLNPRSHAVKHVEMAVLRCLQFIELFEQWEEEWYDPSYQGVQDWRDIDPSEYRKIYGPDHYEVQPRMEIEELWNRYKDGRIYRQVLEWVENVPLDSLSDERRKEIERGISRCRERVGS